jgi:hypothetical protein
MKADSTTGVSSAPVRAEKVWRYLSFLDLSGCFNESNSGYSVRIFSMISGKSPLPAINSST